jgi:superfamily I DNA/RNA helicase
METKDQLASYDLIVNTPLYGIHNPSTFHSFCDRILKRYGLSIGIPSNYKLLEQTGSWILIRKNFDKINFLKEL